MRATTKQCTVCNLTKPATDFPIYEQRPRPGKRRGKCRDCYNNHNRTYMRTYMRKYINNPEYKAKARAYSQSPNKAWPEITNSQAHLMVSNYHTRPERIRDLFEFQDRKCWACKKELRLEGGSTRTFHIDHDHNCCSTPGKSCGKCIRSLLCPRCNALSADQLTITQIAEALKLPATLAMKQGKKPLPIKIPPIPRDYADSGPIPEHAASR